MKEEKPSKKAWVVSVDMGYGHQRTAYPLRSIAFGGKIINANNYPGIPKKDQEIWHTTRSLYEFISRFRRIPFIGIFLFLFLDRFQKIVGYYPKRDMSKSNFGGKALFSFIKKGWGKDLVMNMQHPALPLISTFFAPVFMAEHFGYPNDMYCVICDADIARAWVSLEPKKSRIKYFASNNWTRDRLKLYGVPPENIIMSGYPLPKENLGGKNLATAKKDLGYRLLNLDPSGRYRQLYSPLIKSYLGELPKLPNHPLTIMFSIGGAGAQKEIALSIIKSLKEKIVAKELRFIIAVGTRPELKSYFTDRAKELELDGWLQVLYGKTMEEYFEAFNQALRTTDMLMTKPSELSFYAGLGIPIIIQPSIGSQEDFNRRWLLHTGAGVLQENPSYTSEWLFDILGSGDLAEMAMQGFIEIEKMGTYNIEDIISK
ncbi:hypothetical protein KW786_02980 [Candidatus Parcubacteria bacterium]|nr:hypothetical protein [Candidatus Parcubacteria bacterium]